MTGQKESVLSSIIILNGWHRDCRRGCCLKRKWREYIPRSEECHQRGRWLPVVCNTPQPKSRSYPFRHLDEITVDKTCTGFYSSVANSVSCNRWLWKRFLEDLLAASLFRSGPRSWQHAEKAPSPSRGFLTAGVSMENQDLYCGARPS